MNSKNKTDYPPETAGFKMISNVPVAHISNTARDVINNIERQAISFETIHYTYVLDGYKHLIGVVSLKEIFNADPAAQVKEIMQTDIITVTPETDQEHIALLALKHNIKAIPVVTKKNLFLGIVTSDTILNILNSENIEDVLLSAGVGNFEDPAKSIIKAPAITHIKNRLPWLLLGLGGGILAAIVVGSFEEVLHEHLLLAAFIPTVVYMADAVGAQTQIIFIRSLALDRSMNLYKYIWRESYIGLTLALILGILTTAFSYLIWHSPGLSAIFGMSLFATILMAMIVAIVMPLLLHRVKADPAVASGPFATVVRDLLSIFIYFGIAQILIGSVT